jgi:hypothetical protein
LLFAEVDCCESLFQELIEQIVAIKHDAEELSGIVSPRAGGLNAKIAKSSIPKT